MFEQFSSLRRTALENVLLAWTMLSVLFGLYALLGGQVQIYRDTPEGMLLMFLAIGCAGWLLWHMRKPTSRILYLGIIYWALQIVSARLGMMPFAFSLGLKINYRVIDTPDLTIQIDLLAALTTYLFHVAADQRANNEFQAWKSAQNQPPSRSGDVPTPEE